MNTSSLAKVALNIFSVSALSRMTIFVMLIGLAAPYAFGAKGGVKGKPGGGDDPPAECTDVFPGFFYNTPESRKSSGELRLSSVDGCRTELLEGFVTHGTKHVTEDWSKGVVIWSEDPDNTNQYTLKRQDFSFDGDGKPVPGAIITLLPLANEAIQPDDHLFYGSPDILGDATHESLYLVVTRGHRSNLSGVSTFDLLIYNLNDMTDVVEIYRSAQADGNWNCPDVAYPQFVPGCYGVDGLVINQSGTRLYIPDEIDDKQGQRWHGLIRIDIHRFDLAGIKLPLIDWNFSPPELVFATGTESFFNLQTRPAEYRFDLPFTEHISFSQFGGGGETVDADYCAELYDPHAGGDFEAPDDFWRTDGCIVNADAGSGSWETQNTVLFSKSRSNGRKDIYRRYIDTGTEQLLIENASGADPAQ